VTKDVPDFGIVAGNPAKLLRFRFPADVQEVIRDSKWWEHSAEDCARHMEFIITPVDRQELFLNPLLAGAARSRSVVKGEPSEISGVAGI
jgi:hypothetical protein